MKATVCFIRFAYLLIMGLTMVYLCRLVDCRFVAWSASINSSGTGTDVAKRQLRGEAGFSHIGGAVAGLRG